ncbi:hypothetical protein [Methylovirgula sp. 4M-Z18]|uniref:hypothetical protein n=1 Tax=Methylovirgula sp. 4M-Z18 TaxID=2293567 RepID=UPI0011C04135|nr:hypothetical protein [Methylovirgula sp. 4M-Z18]
MGEIDRKQFRDAVIEVKKAWVFEDWAPVLTPLFRLAMFDMLPVLDELSGLDRAKLISAANLIQNQGRLGDISWRRLKFAVTVIEKREISDFGLNDDNQVNDGRVFLGCTRLVDSEVRAEIIKALDQARAAIKNGDKGTEYATLGGDENRCCGEACIAWNKVLVGKRRAQPGASLDSSLAAAAHYMLARFHVCAAKASIGQMDMVIDMYDNKKRDAIARGDRDLKSMALKPGSRPYPPDFGIKRWAKQGSIEGEADRQRCNANSSTPYIFPDVDGGEA